MVRGITCLRVPKKRQCSRKWASPAYCAGSHSEPTCIQAYERDIIIASVRELSVQCLHIQRGGGDSGVRV